MTTFFTRNLMLLLAAMTCSWAMAQNTLSNTIEESLGDLSNGKLVIEHHHGTLEVRRSDSQDARLQLNISVKGNNEQDMEVLLSLIEMQVSGSAKNRTVRTFDLIKSWNNNLLGQSRLKLKTGHVLEGIRDLDLHLVAFVPNLQSLSLTNRYEDIHVGRIAADLDVNLYSADLFAEHIEGRVNAEIKYGGGKLGHVGDAKIDIYESKLEVQSAREVDLESKYSEMVLGDLMSLRHNSYEDEVSLGSVEGKVVIEAKYSEIEMKQLGDIELDFYETDLQTGDGRNVSGTAKYGSLEFGTLKSIDLASDYEVDINIEQVNALALRASKYGDVEVGQVKEGIYINSYETLVEVDKLSDSFVELWVDSKYESMRLPLGNFKGQLDVELKYGDIEYDRDLFQKQHSRSEKNNMITVQAGSDGEGKIYIRGYETEFDLN